MSTPRSSGGKAQRSRARAALAALFRYRERVDALAEAAEQAAVVANDGGDAPSEETTAQAAGGASSQLRRTLLFHSVGMFASRVAAAFGRVEKRGARTGKSGGPPASA